MRSTFLSTKTQTQPCCGSQLQRSQYFPQELENTKDRSKINIGLRIIWYAVVVHVHLLWDLMGGAEEV